jgi:hypothetical protein
VAIASLEKVLHLQQRKGFAFVATTDSDILEVSQQYLGI